MEGSGPGAFGWFTFRRNMRYHRAGKRAGARMSGQSETTATECRWEIDGLVLAGLAWGPEDGTRVLALHGWMDHAASFQELAPRLTGCRVVALDLSGQGLSAHRAPHATYNIWDDLPQIAGLLDLMGWPDCVLMGHSRGANIATLFTAAQPERVRALIALDSLVPAPSEAGVVATLRAFVEETRAQQSRPPRTFPTREAYLERRRAQGNAPHVSEALAGRALEPVPGGFHLRGDRRLFASSAVKLTQADIEAVLRAIRCPVLNIWAETGIAATRPEAARLPDFGAALIADYQTVRLPGDHHFHLDPAIAGRMADAIGDFLARRLPG